MKGTCTTCGTTLHSDISRVFEQCGACRSAVERQNAPQWAHPEPKRPEQKPPTRKPA